MFYGYYWNAIKCIIKVIKILVYFNKLLVILPKCSNYN